MLLTKFCSVNQVSKPMPVLLKQSYPVSKECIANFICMHSLTQGNIFRRFFKSFSYKGKDYNFASG